MYGMTISYKNIKAGSAEPQLKGPYTEEGPPSCQILFPEMPGQSEHQPLRGEGEARALLPTRMAKRKGPHVRPPQG